MDGDSSLYDSSLSAMVSLVGHLQHWLAQLSHKPAAPSASMFVLTLML